jgi:hypothetical protein
VGWLMTWQNRIARCQVRELDLFGHWASRWRVIRTSNAYVFRDPRACRLPSPKIGREHGIKRFNHLLGRNLATARGSANTSQSWQPPIGGGAAAARSKIAREGEQQAGSCLIIAASAGPGSIEAASTGGSSGEQPKGLCGAGRGNGATPAYHTTRAGRLEQPVKRFLRLPQGGSIDLDQTIDRHIRRAPKSIWMHRSSRFRYVGIAE